MNDDEKQTFTNRHGRRLAVTDNELRELDIEDKPKSSQTRRSEAPQITLKKPRRGFKKALVAGVVLLVVLAGALAAATEWDRHQYDQATASYRDQIDSTRQFLQASDTDTFMTSINEAKNALRSDTESCEGWSTLLTTLNPRTADAREACEAARQKNLDIADRLAQLRLLGEYATRVDAILAAIPESNGEFAVLVAQRDGWAKAEDELAAVEAPAQLAQQHASLSESVEALADNWQLIVAANADQSEGNFMAAEDALAEGYERLREQAQGIDQAFNEPQKALLESVSA